MGSTITARGPSQTGAEQETNDGFTSSSYRSSLGQLTGYFRAKGVPRDEAADLANETVVRVLVHLKRHGRERTDLGPLARTIARNLLVERVRKTVPVLVPLADDLNVADEALEPAEHVLVSECRADVRRAIRSLSPRHRHVVGMWMDGRTPAEIARSLGIKRNAVDAVLHRARRSLASKLDGGGVLGLVALVGLRIRLLGRRVASAVGALDPSGQTAPAAMMVATMGLAAVLTITQPASAGEPNTPRAAARAAAAKAGVVEKTRDMREATTMRTTAREVRAPVAATKEYKMDVVSAPVTDPITGEKGESGIWITYEPDEGMSTPLDPVVEAAIEGCVSTGQCSEAP